MHRKLVLGRSSGTGPGEGVILHFSAVRRAPAFGDDGAFADLGKG
jgi:hypothetical protein